MEIIKQYRNSIILGLGLALIVFIQLCVYIRLSDLDSKTADIVDVLCPQMLGAYSEEIEETREALNETLKIYLKRLEVERSVNNNNRSDHNNDQANQGKQVKIDVITQDLLAQVAYLIDMTDPGVNHENCSRLVPD
ncbi:MAG: hypothetical protein FI727_01765 [SAR202 cluster bacterium]|nr:hypothetical protein [SAR202 cluster bacterium]|tara:strand:- start:344 stop:751 length:408 start_codon:yes stop_codon:yes gene_type:complete